MTKKNRFIVRSAEEKDLQDLYELAQQASLVSLPPDKPVLNQLIQSSILSFKDQMPFEDAVFVFVLEDLSRKKVIGESLVHSSCASEAHPYYYFKLREKVQKSSDLKIKINHQVLRLSSEIGGVSMCGGLILDRKFHSHPEKLGSVIALTRFLYMGMFKEKFNPKVLSEVVAPLSKNGRNPFWDAVGQPFTGIDFNRFMELNRQGNMNFTGQLFPREDIYLCLMDESVRPSEERLRETVGKLAKRIIEKVGFRYLNRIHFHGGPILGVNLDEIRLIKNGSYFQAIGDDNFPASTQMAFVGTFKHDRFTGGHFPVILRGKNAWLDRSVLRVLNIEEKESIFVCLADACEKND
ncbi:arginine succinyltransferase [Desulfocicer vacuolatum DSM 3385]|uniref:Arginine succinyltransferase n=1 Tax=Desulfocicer vacuolatum DSM 3385 TaxID=1121400 RepID=A0A1W2E9E6_9BACT|nr:arginine N-succinyltransferase [Desulfocicer vacuolatum]SMD06285.1 arginine succinyltransferase [Desulfocicer vacuolatum DSM 3385]